MTPKEKAQELVDKFYQRFPLKMDVITTKGDLSWEYDNWKEAKECALIAVDEIIQSDWFITTEQDKTHWDNYWQEVKTEIDNL
jgi:hypothetical protein